MGVVKRHSEVMTSSTVRVSTEKVRLTQSDPRWVEFQHWYFFREQYPFISMVLGLI